MKFNCVVSSQAMGVTSCLFLQGFYMVQEICFWELLMYELCNSCQLPVSLKWENASVIQFQMISWKISNIFTQSRKLLDCSLFRFISRKKMQCNICLSMIFTWIQSNATLFSWFVKKRDNLVNVLSIATLELGPSLGTTKFVIYLSMLHGSKNSSIVRKTMRKLFQQLNEQTQQ